MNELIFVERWKSEKPMYKAWGDFIIQQIESELQEYGIENLDSFFKIPVKSRLKTQDSLLDKAFRRNKSYTDPYLEIEDKVGIRFVVLLTADIEIIENIIKNNSFWTYNLSRDFKEEQEKDPLIFTYQSVHFILRPKTSIIHSGVQIETSTPCEVQIRTILQHAHAELTHDAIYKSKRIAQPAVHRTVAKSMALIETTDEFFCRVKHKLNNGLLVDLKIVEKLDSLYIQITGLQPIHQKSSLSIWDTFEDFINTDLIQNIQIFTAKNPYIAEIVKQKYHENSIYRESVVLFIFWMLKRHKNVLLNNWPLPLQNLDPVASDIGISIQID